MRGVYVISYREVNNGVRTVTLNHFKRKGIRFYLYVAFKKIQGKEVEVVEL